MSDSVNIGDVVCRMRADTSDFTSQIAALGKALDPLGGQFTDLGTAAFGLVGPFSDLQSQGNELAAGATFAGSFETFLNLINSQPFALRPTEEMPS